MNTLAPLVAMITCTVAANLLMKTGAADDPAPVLLNMLSWRTIFGLAVFAGAGVLYARVLRVLPLNVAQSFAAAQFVAVILGSRLFLGEAVPLARWVGIGAIAIGIVIIAWHDT